MLIIPNTLNENNRDEDFHYHLFPGNVITFVYGTIMSGNIKRSFSKYK